METEKTMSKKTKVIIWSVIIVLVLAAAGYIYYPRKLTIDEKAVDRPVSIDQVLDFPIIITDTDAKQELIDILNLISFRRNVPLFTTSGGSDTYFINIFGSSTLLSVSMPSQGWVGAVKAEDGKYVAYKTQALFDFLLEHADLEKVPEENWELKGVSGYNVRDALKQLDMFRAFVSGTDLELQSFSSIGRTHDSDGRMESVQFSISKDALLSETDFIDEATHYLSYCAAFPYDTANEAEAAAFIEDNIQKVVGGDTPISIVIGDTKFELRAHKADGNVSSIMLIVSGK